MDVSIILLFFVVAAFFLNELYKHTNSFRNQFIDISKYRKSNVVNNDTEILNLGSNHPKFGLDYSETDVSGVNCAVGPQTLEYDFAILRKITSTIDYNGCVVIPICLLKMFLYRQVYRTVHYKYYTILSPSDIVGYSYTEKIINLWFPLFFHPRNIIRFIKDVKKDNRLDLDHNPLTTEEELNKDADMWINSWNKEFDIQLPTPELSQANKNDIRDNIRILRGMLEYCKSHGMKPVLVILPVTEYLSTRFPDDFVNNHILSYLKEANTVGAPIMNYLRDKRFTSPDLYINSFFMNKKGRKKFTKVFVEELKAKNIL